ncbi:MAG: hypothetical protein LH468_03155, partial [Nocardioides sp.]|nr:hypothetical protein [Nocardioides sp.]
MSDARPRGPLRAAGGTPLVVGFDLDMTLIDTVPGFTATLVALGAELGIDLPVEAMTARLGPPLDDLLGEHLPAAAVAAAGDPVPELYPDCVLYT